MVASVARCKQPPDLHQTSTRAPTRITRRHPHNMLKLVRRSGTARTHSVTVAPLPSPPAPLAAAAVHTGRSTSWLPAWPSSSLSGVSIDSSPRGATACGQDSALTGGSLSSELHCGAHCAASHHQAGGAAHCGEDGGASAHHQGLSSGAHHQGLSSLRSLSSASSSRLP